MQVSAASDDGASPSAASSSTVPRAQLSHSLPRPFSENGEMCSEKRPVSFCPKLFTDAKLPAAPSLKRASPGVTEVDAAMRKVSAEDARTKARMSLHADHGGQQIHIHMHIHNHETHRS